MNKILILVLSLVLINLSFVSAISDSYTMSWHVPSAEVPTESISHISPSFTNKVPHIHLGEYINFKGLLSLLNNLKWTTNIIHLVLLL